MTPGASTITLVAAVASNGVIGRDGDLPWHLPDDLKRFKATTVGHVVVMGRVTYDSIGRPLPGRTTIVVTRQPGWQPAGGLPAGLLVVNSVEAALAQGRHLDEQVFVVGGGQVYAEALAFADVLLISCVDAAPAGDVYFPPVEWRHWAEVSRADHDGWSLIRYERAKIRM